MLSKNKKGRSTSLFDTQIKLSDELVEQINLINQRRSEKYLDSEKEKEENLNKLIKKMISTNLAEMKESIHKDYLQFQHRINDSIQSYAQNLKNVSNFEKRLIEQFANIKIKTEKIEIVSEKLDKMDDRLTIYEIRCNNLSRDLRVAIDKYDSLFLDNMSVPGKIGNFCKYKNIREFLSFAYNKFNEFDLKKESDAAKMRYSQEKIQKFMKKINCEMDILREEIVQISAKKSSFLEKRLNEEISEINKKIQIMPINNNSSDDLEKKLNELIDNYNEMKNIQNNLYERLNMIEDNIENIKENKSPKSPRHKNINSEKKNSKVSFSNLSGLKQNNIKKDEEESHEKKYSPILSKKVQKYNSLNNQNATVDNDNNNNNNNEKKELTLKLDNINEENDDDGVTPLDKLFIKSVNFSSHRFRNVNTDNTGNNNNENSKSSKTIGVNEKNILNNLISIKPRLNLNLTGDSSDDEEKKQKIEEIIVDNNKKEERSNIFDLKVMEMSNSYNEKNEIYPSRTRRKTKKIVKIKQKMSSKSISSGYNKSKIRNYHTFPKTKFDSNGKKNNLSNKSKIENKMSNEKIKKILDKSNKSLKEKTIEISFNKKENLNKDQKYSKNKEDKKDKNESNRKKKNNNNILNKSIIKNIDVKNNNIKNEFKTSNNILSTRKIKQESNINKNSNNNSNKNINNNTKNNIQNITIINKKDKNNLNEIGYNIKNIISEKEKEKKKENSQKNLPNIEIFNNSSIKNYLNKYPYKENKKTLTKNKSFDYPKISNNYSTSISIGNFTDVSVINNIHFSNNEISKKNREMPNKSGIYNLFKLEALKKEEFLKNNKPTISNPNEIPIITNSSLYTQSQSHSLSKKKLKKEKIFQIYNNKSKFNGKKREKNINLELKIIPAGFKISKKIQVNLSDG